MKILRVIHFLFFAYSLLILQDTDQFSVLESCNHDLRDIVEMVEIWQERKRNID